MLGDIGQDHVRRDRRHLVEPRLAELALDVIFLGEAKAAVGLQAHVGGAPAGFGGQQLGDIGLLAARQAGFVTGGGVIDRQARGVSWA
jgi:hypothetical protein